MSECKISIVIPVYNVMNYLEECMESVVNQTFKEYEIIIVNDGSTDRSPQILNEYKEKYPELITVYDIENRGVSHARNYAVKRARGEYVLFVDSDDYIELNMCELLYNKAVEDEADIVICERYDFYENEENGRIKKTKSAGFYMPFNRKINLNTMKYELVHISPFPWDKLYRIELVNKFPFPEGIRFEDLAVMYQICLSAGKISVIPEYLYNYRRSTSGGFLNSFSKETKDIVKACRKIIEDFKENEWFKDYYEEVEYICVRHLLLRYNVLFGKEQKGKLELKRELIHDTQDFLDENFDDWRNNRYLMYSTGKGMREKFDSYKNKNAILRKAAYHEYLPAPILKAGLKIKGGAAKIKKFFRDFMRSGSRLRFLKRRLPFFKLIEQPAASKYTKWYEKLTIDPQLVLVESKHGEDLAGNIFQILLSMKDDSYRKFKIQVVLKEKFMEQYEALLEQYDIDYAETIILGSDEYLMALASAKYLVTDTSFPTYYIKRPEQVYMNTWHGTPLKGMGRIVPNREYALGNIQRNFFMADYLLYQNEFSKEIFLEDYMLDKMYQGEVIVSGYPRNSAFFNEKSRKNIRRELDAKEKTVIVYMPTWRGLLNKKENDRQLRIISGYLKKIDKVLRDDQLFYVKFHPYVKKNIQCEDYFNIKPIPEEYETYDFLNASDVLVTDYSSIMFDYAVSGRSIVLFTYDKDEYLADRGMYLNIDELEFVKAATVKELMKAIDQPIEYPEFKKKFCPYDTKGTKDEITKHWLLNAQSNLKTWRVKQSAKKKVLLFAAGLKIEEDEAEFVRRMNALDTDKYDYYLCFDQAAAKKNTEVISKMKKEIYYFPISYGVSSTRGEKIALACYLRLGIEGFGIRKKMIKLAHRERVKYFSDFEFDYVVNYSLRDKILHLVCQDFDAVKILNLQEYDKKKFKEDGKYIRGTAYLLKHAWGFNRVYVAPELLKYSNKIKEITEIKSDSMLGIDEMINREDGSRS